MRRSKKTGYTSFDVFKEDLTEKTAALISKGYIPSYLGLREGQDVTKEDIRKIIDKKFTREKYEHQIKGVKERAVDMGRIEKNANRTLIDQYLYDVTYKQTKAISKMFEEDFGIKVSARAIRLNAKDPDWEHWDEYSKLYHQMRDEGFTAGAIQSLIWGS